MSYINIYFILCIFWYTFVQLNSKRSQTNEAYVKGRERKERTSIEPQNHNKRKQTLQCQNHNKGFKQNCLLRPALSPGGAAFFFCQPNHHAGSPGSTQAGTPAEGVATGAASGPDTKNAGIRIPVAFQPQPAAFHDAFFKASRSLPAPCWPLKVHAINTKTAKFKFSVLKSQTGN